ncbi:MAG: hypothetical protein H6579_06915 [Chitinophagales bacterium]|nr:hypothetical protein [Chitinophagales bacterium]
MASNIRHSIKPFIDAIVFSNIWIALAALSLHFFVLDSLHVNPSRNAAALIFLGTFISYNFLKLRGLENQENQSVFFLWMRQHKLILQVSLALASFPTLYLVLGLEKLQFIVLFFAGSTIILYLGVASFNLRKYWFLKTPIVGIVWTIILVVFSLSSQEDFLSFNNFLSASLFVYFLVVGLTIPFELRDFKVDQQVQEASTLPMKIGTRRTKALAIVHLIVALFFLLQFNQEAYGVILLILYAIRRIIQLEISSSEYEFSLILDGVLVAIYPSVLLVKYLLGLFSF